LLLKPKKVVNKSAEMIKLSLNNEEKLAMGQGNPFNNIIVPMNYSPKSTIHRLQACGNKNNILGAFYANVADPKVFKLLA
jgi:hypothetical protein